MKKLALVASPNRPDVAAVLEEFRALVAGRAEVVMSDTTGAADLSELNADLVVAFGGDGTILGAARRMRANQIPVIGINFGKLGFIAEFTYDVVRDNLDDLLADKYPVTKLRMLKCIVEKDKMPLQSYYALNDVVIMRNNTPRMIELHIHSRDRFVIDYFGDGLIISSPIGSSAHNLAAGGPLIFPDLDVMALTPVCPNSIASRPIIIPMKHGIRIHVAGADQQVSYTVDGQIFELLERDHSILVRMAKNPLQLVTRRSVNYYDILKRKLNWGALPNYRRTRPDHEPPAAPEA